MMRRSRLLSRTGARSAGAAAGDRLAGRRVDQPVGGVLDEDALALGAEQETPVLQRTDDGRGERIAARRDAVDALDGVVETVGREAQQRILVGPGLRAAQQGGQHAERDDERHQAIAEGKHPDVPASKGSGGPILTTFGPPRFSSDGGDNQPPPHFLVTLL